MRNLAQTARMAVLSLALALPVTAGAQDLGPTDPVITAKPIGPADQAESRTGRPSEYRRESGHVVALVPVPVRGVSTPNHVAVVATHPDRLVPIDLGQNAARLDLEFGTPISVRGRVVRLGDRGALLLADTATIGRRTYEVNRPAYLPAAIR